MTMQNYLGPVNALTGIRIPILVIVLLTSLHGTPFGRGRVYRHFVYQEITNVRSKTREKYKRISSRYVLLLVETERAINVTLSPAFTSLRKEEGREEGKRAIVSLGRHKGCRRLSDVDGYAPRRG